MSSNDVIGTGIEVWRTIVVGGKSRDELLAELEIAGFEVGRWARDMMAQKAFVTESEPREIDIVLPSLIELGFRRMVTTREIWARAKDLGLEPCPPSIGPHLRLAHGDQPLHDWIWVAMEPIVDSVADPEVFAVGYDDDGRWLDGTVVRTFDSWHLDSRIAFVASKRGPTPVNQPVVVPPRAVVFNLGASPTLPDIKGFWEGCRHPLFKGRIEWHSPGGSFVWDPARVKLHREPEQASWCGIVGTELIKRPALASAFNATLLDCLLDHSELIPVAWMGKRVYFWGTVFAKRYSDLFVPFLYWNGYCWDRYWSEVRGVWGLRDLAAVPAGT